jgi:hypothetical protein
MATTTEEGAVHPHDWKDCGGRGQPGLFYVAARLRAATPDRGHFAEAAAKRKAAKGAAVEAAKALRARPMSREVAAALAKQGFTTP